MSELSKLEIRLKIQQINRLNSANADYGHLKRTYGAMIRSIGVVLGKCRSSEMFFRARVVRNGLNLFLVSDLLAPPPRLVSGYQRCNPPGKPMFYTASRRVAALLECGVTAGDVVYLSQWSVKEPIPINLSLDPVQNGSEWRTIDAKEDLIFSHIDTIFTRKIHKDFSDDYKFTSAITEVLTTEFHPEAKQDIRSDGCVALRYPSVADIENSYNTAIHPEFCQDRIDILHAMQIIINSVEKNEITYSVIDNSINFDGGKIHWLNDKTKLPILQDNKNIAKFIFDGSQWRIQTIDFIPTDEYLRNLLID